MLVLILLTVLIFLVCIIISSNNASCLSNVSRGGTTEKIIIEEIFNTSVALSYANLSMAAYYTNSSQTSTMLSYIQKSNITAHNIQTFYNPSTGASGLIFSNDSAIYISFTGTNFTHWKTIEDDLTDTMVPFDGGKVCKGFLEAWSSVEQYILNYLSFLNLNDSPNKICNITGHSLGGAVATLCASSLSSKFKNIALYTFASPRVGDNSFAQSFNSLNITSVRIQNCRDIIPRLPTIDLQGYQHINTLALLIVSKNNNLCVLNITNASGYLFDPFDWLNEHKLDTYITLLSSCNTVTV